MEGKVGSIFNALIAALWLAASALTPVAGQTVQSQPSLDDAVFYTTPSALRGSVVVSISDVAQDVHRAQHECRAIFDPAAYRKCMLEHLPAATKEAVERTFTMRFY